MFLYNKRPVLYCNSYKYLGCYINEYLEYSYTAQMQADSAGRALSLLISKMIKNKGFPFSVFSKLYQACICSISLYGGEVFGYNRYDSLLNLHLRATRAFLGLPKNTATFGLISELNWLLPHFSAQVKIVQHFGRVLGISDTRMIKKVYTWDYRLNSMEKIKTWSSEVWAILRESNCHSPTTTTTPTTKQP